MSTEKKPVRKRIEEIIFRHDTPASKAFDITLLVLIAASILIVMLESVKHLDDQFHKWFWGIEWVLTILFTLEYVMRLYSTDRKKEYATSFYGIIDLLAIIPTYLTLFAIPIHYLTTIRALRLLRIFRILKMSQFLIEGNILWEALRASQKKITVFIVTILTLTVILGSVMYMIESDESGFTSIPRSIYWAIVTLTTVGYGDISPVTPLGQFIAALVMILGYGVLAVPTGIVSAEMVQADKDKKRSKKPRVVIPDTLSCPYCQRDGLDKDSIYCKQCGRELDEIFS